MPGDQALLLHNYLMAAEDWPADIVEDAVTLYIKGKVPGFDGRFAPTAPMLDTGCRLVTEQRARERYLDGLSAPRLPSPDIERTQEQRARAKAQVDAFVATQKAVELTAEETKQRAERWAKVNARFDPPQDDASVMQRLMGYSVGAPESDDAAA
jgi:hypothetical protein